MLEFQDLRALRGLEGYERRKILKLREDFKRGLRLLKKIRAQKKGVLKLPGEAIWEEVLGFEEKEKAQWFLQNCPEVGSFEYNAFRRLVKAFGMEGSEFYYWLRKLR